MILAIMTLTTIAAFQESATEMYIAKNDLASSLSFYCAEAAMVEASNAIENIPTAQLHEIMGDDTTYANRTLKWVHSDIDGRAPDLDDDNNWQSVSSILTNTNQCREAQYIAIQNIYEDGDVMRNESLDMNKTGDNVYEYSLIAQSTDGGTIARVEVGYRRRF